MKQPFFHLYEWASYNRVSQLKSVAACGSLNSESDDYYMLLALLTTNEPIIKPILQLDGSNRWSVAKIEPIHYMLCNN